MNVEERIINVISCTFNLDKTQISLSYKKDDFESWDSLGHLQLIMALESEFGIKFKTDEIAQIESVDNCVDMVNKIINRK